MEVLLINPPTENMLQTEVPTFLSEERGHNPALGLMYVAASIIQHTKHEVRIIDAQVEELTYTQLKQRIDSFCPDIVGITTTSFTLIDALKTAALAKPAKVVLGGPHVHLYPVQTAKLPNIDYLILGEAEEPMVQLLQNLDNLDRVDNLVYKRGDEVVMNQWKGLVKDLDKLPFPARDLTPYKKYTSLLAKRTPVTTMITSRGCPKKCIFCNRPNLGKVFRPRSPQNVVREFEQCYDMGIKEFLIYDDTFGIDRKRVMKICNLLIEKRMDIGWDIRTRVDSVDNEQLALLKKAGCERIHYGVECLAPDTRIQMGDGSIKRIDSLKGEFEVVSANFNEMQLTSSEAKSIKKEEAQEMLIIKTKQPSREIICSKDHKFFKFNDGFITPVKAEDLSVGSLVAVMIEKSGLGDASIDSISPLIDDYFMEFLGYFVGDGNSYESKNRIRLYDKNKELLGYHKANLDRKTKNVVYIKKGKGNSNYLQVISKEIYGVIKHLGQNVTQPNRYIPEKVMCSNDQYVSAFLKGFFDAEGTVLKDGLAISSSSEKLIVQTKLLLLRLGIESSTIFSSKYKKFGKMRTQYRLCIKSRDSIKRYSEKIGFNEQDKAMRLDGLVNKKISWPIRTSKHPVERDYLRQILLKNKVSTTKLSTRSFFYKKDWVLSKPLVKRVIAESEEQIGCQLGGVSLIKKIAHSSEIGWAKIESIKKTHSDVVYDLTVPNNHNYVANGFIVHNSGTEHILRVLKKDITLDQARAAFRKTREARIDTLAYFIFGNPEETIVEMDQTIKFAKELKPGFCHFSILTLFPQTPVYNMALKMGLPDVWKEYATNPTSDFVPPLWDYYPRDVMINQLEKAYKSFYVRPSYIINKVLKIRSREEFKRKIRAGLKVLKL